MITAVQCRELFIYDSLTGLFRWRVQKGRRGVQGNIAGSMHKCGYVNIQIDGVKYMCHRLAWLYVHGEMPPEFIDHRDGRRTNNAIQNLRLADRSFNSQNIKGPRADNLSGMLGASANGKRWKACINLLGVRKYLGTFDTPEEASAAYLTAKREIHPANTL